MRSRRDSNSDVQDWLDGQYEYVGPEYETAQEAKSPQFSRHVEPPSTSGIYGRIGRDGFREMPPEGSDTSSIGKVHPRDRYRPPTPPPDTFDQPRRTRRREREYERERPRPRERDIARDERRPSPHRRDTRHPPPARHGRPLERPHLATATTAPPVSKREESPYRRRRHHTSSPTRHRPSRHHMSPPPPTSHTPRRGKSTKEPTRPPITRSKTTKDKSMAFIESPRFQKAAAAALEAGATTAFGLRGQKGPWGGEKGAKVATAALGAAALDALRKNEAAKAKPVAEPPPVASKSAGGVEMFGNAVGGYLADQLARRRSQRKTK